jgi:hypothetical protein
VDVLMSWISVAKPTGSPYTRVNPVGREQYDDAGVIFDSTTVFYDGIDQTIWTTVAKPAGDTWNDMTMTWNANLNTWNSVIWTSINKPT